MTGYGRGQSVLKGIKFTAEVTSLNRKQGVVTLGLPREFEILEPQVRQVVYEYIARGKLMVRIHSERGGAGASPRVRIDRQRAKSYLHEFRALGKELHLSDSVSLQTLIQIPGVLEVEEVKLSTEECWPAIERALRKALGDLVRMRKREGAHLQQDLRSRVAKMRAAAKRIGKVAPEVLKRYRSQLQARVKAAGLHLTAEEDERLVKELVYFADRSDITEELTRLESHFLQSEECLARKAPVGRTLDFLSQEMNREINTIGAKANSSRISREVVTLKAELEKFREQVQNIE